jgi:D-glycero-D-manno-heptose 1,7-bisphosphate phosphatase
VANNKAVFLDRDGVLNAPEIRNGRTYAPTSIDAFRILPGAIEAVQKLHDAGYFTIVVTNQPDLTTGKVDAQTVAAFHQCLQAAMPLDDIMICPHVNEDNCECRKPKPGLLIQAAEKHEIDLAQSFLVGDLWRDIDAAHAAGCTSYFVDYGYDEPLRQEPNYIVRDLLEASRLIITQNKR